MLTSISDLQTVSVTFKVFFRPDQNELSFLFSNIGTRMNVHCELLLAILL